MLAAVPKFRTVSCNRSMNANAHCSETTNSTLTCEPLLLASKQLRTPNVCLIWFSGLSKYSWTHSNLKLIYIFMRWNLHDYEPIIDIVMLNNLSFQFQFNFNIYNVAVTWFGGWSFSWITIAGLANWIRISNGAT